jgi:SAM-dependent methyltransferase
MTDTLWQKLNPNNNEIKISKEESMSYKNNWKESHLGEKQRQFVNEELKQLKNGQTPYVYNGFLQLLNLIEGEKLTFLDIGCASGYYKEVADHGSPNKLLYSGCDYNEASVKLARQYYTDTDFRVEDVTNLGYSDKQFDAVMVSGVLEHVPDQTKAFDETCRVAKDWLLCHRIGLTSLEEHFTKGSQYETPVVRYYFDREKFIKRVTDRGFVLKAYIDVYPDNKSIQSFLFRRASN